MRRTSRALAVVLALALSAGSIPADAFHGSHFGMCPDLVTTNCVSWLKINTVNGIGGNDPPVNIEPDLFFLELWQIQLKRTDLGLMYPNELSPTLTTSTEITMKIRFTTFEPTLLLGGGKITTWTWDDNTKEMTIIGFPVGSSASTTPGCIPPYPGACATADVDFVAIFLLAASAPTPPPGLPPEVEAEFTAFFTSYTGGFITTSGQAVGTPTWLPDSMTMQFIVDGPHFKAGGVTLNTVFATFLVPDPVFSVLWGIDPNSFSASSVTVTVDGVPTTVTVSRFNARSGFPPGWLFQLVNVTLSSPKIEISPAQASSVVPDAPVAIPSDPAGKAVDTTRPVQIPQSGVFAVPVTVSRGASLAFAQGTAATTGGAPFRGVVHPPFPIAVDPTGRGIVSIVQVGVNGVGPGADVLLDKPATLTLIPPATASASATSATAAAYQPVDLDAPGGPRYLLGRATDKGIAVDIKRLRQGPNRFGLAKIPRPAVKAVSPAFEKLSGFHSRYAGQSASLELAPGQLVDVDVRLVNAGSEPWVRGEAGREARLGSAGPLDNTRDFDLGVLIAPVAGQSRFASTTEAVVAPGALGTFPMRLRAPLTAGTHRVNLRPVIDGVTWMEDQGIYVELVVK